MKTLRPLLCLSLCLFLPSAHAAPVAREQLRHAAAGSEGAVWDGGAGKPALAVSPSAPPAAPAALAEGRKEPESYGRKTAKGFALCALAGLGAGLLFGLLLGPTAGLIVGPLVFMLGAVAFVAEPPYPPRGRFDE